MNRNTLVTNDHNYRMEGRNVFDYHADIRKGHEREADVMKRFVKLMKKQGKKLHVQNNGCDPTGRKLLRPDQATVEPDFKVDGKFLEVKTSAGHFEQLHLKVDQLKRYVNHFKSEILYVKGYNTPNPVYTIMTVDQLRKVLKTHTPEVKWESHGTTKSVLKVSADMFDWKPFE